MKRVLLIAISLCCTSMLIGQNKSDYFNLSLGAAYNYSPVYNQNTGTSIFIEPNFLINDKYRIGYRFEPTVLSYGVGEIWRPSCPVCKSDANYVLNNYFKVDYVFGKSKSKQNGINFRAYAGLNLNVLTHKRWIITAIDAFTLENSHEWRTNVGAGLQAGILLGRFDIAASFNKTGKHFEDYFGFSVAYKILQVDMKKRKATRSRN